MAGAERSGLSDTPSTGPGGLSCGPQSPPGEPVSHPVFVVGCSGWLHTAVSDTAGCAADGGVAVLLCPALGWDGLHAYRGYRRLADRFAAAGYPALRFQYPGTGDSADLPNTGTLDTGTLDQWDIWRRSVHDAADWLRAATGASRLLLVGLRFGAALALAAAESRTDVGGVLLLAPVLRGKSYMRQLDMEARLEGAGHATPAVDGLHLHEMQFNAHTVAVMSGLDMSQTVLPAGLPVAIAPQAASQVVERCSEAWERAGLRVHRLPFDGLEPLLQEAIHVDPAEPDFSALIAWASRAVPPVPGPAAASAAPLPQPVLDLGPCVEVPLQFGPDRALFGVLCRPATGPGRRAVIIVNTGRDPHYGISRFGVQLARRLAAEGIASLRMDFAGLGDSRPPAQQGDRLSSLFETDRTNDIGAAIDTLEQAGFQEFAIQGLCSGAYHAFRAAQTDKRIGTLLLVNLPVFEWRGGDSVKTVMWTTAPASRMLARLADTALWRRALTGQVDLRPFLQAQHRRWWDAARLRLPVLAHKEPFAKRSMRRLAGRRVRSLFLYSVGDPGLDMVETLFGQSGRGLHAYEGASVRVIDGIDHILSHGPMRELVANEIATFLTDTTRWSGKHDDSFDNPRADDDGRPLAEADARAIA